MATHLSVVVPTLDEEAYLPALLTSLAAQGASAPEETLVVDGGSSDRTRVLADELGARVLTAARGRGPQLAAGARAATGELLCFLHADARLEPGALAAVRAAFEAEPGLAAAGLSQRIDANGRFYRLVERAADGRVRRGEVYGDSGLVVRSAAYTAAGGFGDEPVFEDLSLSRRLARVGPVRLVEGARIVVSARRWQAEGALRRTVVNWTLTALWRAGVDPARLLRYYRPRSPVAERP